MFTCKAGVRASKCTSLQSLCSCKSPLPSFTRRRFLSYRPNHPYAQKRQQHFIRSVTLAIVFGTGLSAYTWYNGALIQDGHAEGPLSALLPQKKEAVERARQLEAQELVFENAITPRDASKADTRDQISSQHLQVRKSWENPGVWCWGANDGKVAAPDSKTDMVRNPRWMQYFDGMLLRDMKLTREFGAAITENGDLLQWGIGYADDSKSPVATLKGKNLTSIVLSKDRVLALSAGGNVYSLSFSKEEQTLGPKPTESSWLPGYSSTSPISYRTLSPKDLGWNERITQISGGLEHVLLLSSKGRVFAAASGSESFPTHGELGIQGLTWFTRPEGAFDMPHEVQSLHGFRMTQVAAGDHHSLALDVKGRVWGWGSNERGQLGIGETSKDITFRDAPEPLPITKLYAGTAQKPHVTSISAGGNTSFLTIDAVRIATPDMDSRAARNLGRVTADVWACGHGIWGQLGNGRWTHVQALPTKIVPLSGLFEYDERARRAIPIRMRSISVGANHVAATMDNVTYTAASDATSANDTNWGADVLFFGNNEFCQLGTGKRNNVVTPTYIQPLDRAAEVKDGKRPKQEEHRFHATPRSTVRVGERWVNFEQRVVCGRGVTAVYSGV